MKIITCALPYANGNLHIGHFFEATLADIKARYLRDNSLLAPCFISGNDCHGAATTLYCYQHGLDIEEHLASQHQEHLKSYEHLKISFDNFSRTNSALHKKVVNWCLENIKDYEAFHGKKILDTQEVESWYDSTSEQFLPDRYVKGDCPHCGAKGQPPEVCENCSQPIGHLLNPYSVLTSSSVILKRTRHLILRCDGFYDEIKKQSHLLHPSIRGKILDNSLEAQTYLDISRDSPYYGIKVEGFPELDNQYYYVWLDAPIGYLTFAFEASGLAHTKDNFLHFLEGLELEHFIGKDIAYFHTFLWINLLQLISSGKSTIEKLNLHGWVTINDEKFSKSKGHHVNLAGLSLEQIDALRLYFFSKSDGSISDTAYSETDILKNYNNLITNGLANYYARVTKLLERHSISLKLVHNHHYNALLEEGNYKKLYETLQADLASLNSEFQASELWKCVDKDRIESACQEGLNRWYAIYRILVWVCPELAKHKVENAQFAHLASRLKEFNLLF